MRESFHVKDVQGVHFVTKDPCLAHNFSPYRFNGVYYSLAGQDRWKMMSKWRGLSYTEFKKEFKEHWGKPYTGGPTKYRTVKEKFDNTPHSKFADGLYLMHSEDGLRWCPKIKNPVITSKHEGFNSALQWKSGEFDSKICINNFNDKYYLYVRDNISQDRRTVQYSTSQDLVNWSRFNRLNIPYDIVFDNYYFFEAFSFNGRVFAFAPYYTDFYCSIRLLMSHDGVNFHTVTDFFKAVPPVVEYDKRKNRDHVVGNIEQDEENIIFYVHHNYLGYDRNAEVNVKSYSLPKRYLECL